MGIMWCMIGSMVSIEVMVMGIQKLLRLREVKVIGLILIITRNT